MDYDKIRNMTNEELKKFLDNIKNRSTKNCIKCDKLSTKFVKIENDDTLQTRKLCGLCNEHYEELLQYLNVQDIDWR